MNTLGYIYIYTESKKQREKGKLSRTEPAIVGQTERSFSTMCAFTQLKYMYDIYI